MKNYYADTSFIIDLFNADEKADHMLENIDNLFTGAPVIYELNKFPKYESDFTDKILNLSPEDVREAAKTWRNLNVNGKRIGEIDHLIAGQVINREMTLITRDKDFKKIKEVEAEYYR